MCKDNNAIINIRHISTINFFIYLDTQETAFCVKKLNIFICPKAFEN